MKQLINELPPAWINNNTSHIQKPAEEIYMGRI